MKVYYGKAVYDSREIEAVLKVLKTIVYHYDDLV